MGNESYKKTRLGERATKGGSYPMLADKIIFNSFTSSGSKKKLTKRPGGFRRGVRGHTYVLNALDNRKNLEGRQYWNRHRLNEKRNDVGHRFSLLIYKKMNSGEYRWGF